MTSSGPVASDSARRGPDRRRLTLLLALAAALLGAVQLLVVAPWMGEDEPWQVEYASHIAAGHRPWGGERMRPVSEVGYDQRTLMPLSQLQMRVRMHGVTPEELAETQTGILESMARHGFYNRVDWAGAEPLRRDFDEVAPTFTAAPQPPLYFVLTGGLMAALGADTAEGRLWVARGLSWVLYVITVLVALAIGRHAFGDERLAFCVAAFVAFLPMSARQAAVVNNDVLARFLATLVLWLAVRWVAGSARRWEPALAVVLCGLGMLADSTAAGAVVVLFAAALLRSRRVASRGGTIATVAALAILVPVIVTIWLVGRSAAVPRTLFGLVKKLEAGFSLEALTKFARTLTASFGWESRFLPDALVAVFVVVVGLGCLVAVTKLVRGRVTGLQPVQLLCLLAVVAQLGLILMRGEGRGRYFMPALTALGVLIAAGLVSAWPAALRQRAATALMLGLVAFEAVFLWGGLVLHEYLLWGV